MERSMLSNPAMVQFFHAYCFAASAYRYGSKMRPNDLHASFNEPQHHVIDPTNPRGALDDGIEHRLHVGGRTADDPEHLGCCGLMLQGLAQFCVALLDLFEQTNVLDGDHGLISESLEKSYLFVRKGLNFRAPNENRSNRKTLPEQWRTDDRPGPVADSSRLREWELPVGLCLQVSDVNELSVDHGSPSDRVTIQRRIIRSSGNHAEMSRIAKNVAIEPMNDSILCIDQTCGIFSDSVKHWLQVCGGVSNNPQNLVGGDLLFQRFGELLA